MDPITQNQPTLGFGNTLPEVPQATPTTAQKAVELKARKDASTTSDYIGSMWRQDGVMDGLIANTVGRQMAPDPTYNPYTDPQSKAREEGIDPSLVGALYDGVVSSNHQEFIRQRLLQKQEDLQRLGEMGTAGDVGRFAFGMFMPENFLTGYTGGLLTRGALAAKAVMAGRAITTMTALDKAALAASTAAEAAASKGTTKAVALGIAGGTAENVAIEKLRQSVNFEDDGGQLLGAALMGLPFVAGFSLAGARTSSRVATAARQEANVLQALQVVQGGGRLTPEQGRLIERTHTTTKAIAELEAGRITPEQFHEATAEAMGPFEPPEMWLQRHGERVSNMAQEIIATHFPGGTGEGLSKLTAEANQAVANTAAKAPDDARAARKTSLLAITKKLLEDEQKARGEALKAHMAKARELKDTLGGLHSKVDPEGKAVLADLAGGDMGDNAMTAAFKRAVKKGGLPEAPQTRFLTAEDAAAEAAAKATKDSAWAKVEADRAAQVQREQEAMVRARELHRMVQEDPLAQMTHPLPPESLPVDAPAVAPVAPAEHPMVGHQVTWQAKDMSIREGTVVGTNQHGFLKVDTGEGVVAVHPTKVDQYAAIMGPQAEAPSGFLPGSIGAAQVQKVVNIWDQRTAMAKARFDYYAILNGSKVSGVRELAYKMIKDPIANDKFEAQGWTASEYKKQLQRQIGGNFHVTLKEAEKEALKLAGQGLWGRDEFLTEFRTLVTREARGDWTVKARMTQAGQKHYPAVAKAAGAYKEAMARALAEAKKAGVLGAEDIPANDLYVTRAWEHHAIREAIEKHGEDAVVNLLARAINVPGHIGDRVKAKQFLGAVRKLEFQDQTTMTHLASRDMGTLRTYLDQVGLHKDEVDAFVDAMFDARAVASGDTGHANRLKFRFDLDENAAEHTTGGLLRVSDLLENDPRVLMDSYLGSVGGHIGLAKVGIESVAAFEAKLRGISEEAIKANVDGAKVAEEMKHLRDLHANITGKPMSGDPHNTLSRLAQSVRGFTRAASLGQLGLVATMEMGKGIAMIGQRAMFESMPTFGKMIQAMRQGYVPDKVLAQQIMDMTGFGTELAHAYTRKHNYEGGWANKTLTFLEKWSSKASHATDILSGNASMTSLSRMVVAQGAARNALDYASGKAMPAKMRARWVAQGINDDDIDHVLANLKKHSVEVNGRLESINYEDWQKASPGTYDRFVLFLNRQAREAIQDQDIGETMPWMHTTLGKVFGELRTFMLVGHAKNFLRSMEFRDVTALRVWLIGLMSETLAYTMQQVINQPADLDKRLEPGEMAKNVHLRMASMGLLPLIEGTAYELITGESFTKPGTTANTDSRSLLKTPSFNTLVRFSNLGNFASGLLGTHETTQRDVSEAFRVLPLARLYGMPLVAQELAGMFPKADPELKSR